MPAGGRPSGGEEGNKRIEKKVETRKQKGKSLLAHGPYAEIYFHPYILHSIAKLCEFC
jgi:hypothetical protein